jgi:ribosomal protein S18 acetylase RimI-like enzyme
MVDAVAIEPIPVDDAGDVARRMPWRQPNRHLERAAAQEARLGIYLVAWRDGEPVGHSFVKWPGSLSSRHAREEGCVEIEDLFVSPEDRDEGIGGALLETSEDAARGRRFEAIGLAVALENDGARRLYERHGYEDAGHGTFTLRWASLDDQGVERTWREECTYLVKTL